MDCSGDIKVETIVPVYGCRNGGVLSSHETRFPRRQIGLDGKLWFRMVLVVVTGIKLKVPYNLVIPTMYVRMYCSMNSDVLATEAAKD